MYLRTHEMYLRAYETTRRGCCTWRSTSLRTYLTDDTNPPAYSTDDAARLLYLEIDYMNEAKNARLFAESMAKQQDVVVPAVYDNATTARARAS